jgi:3-methyladenine DNA glycosylase AlkD
MDALLDELKTKGNRVDARSDRRRSATTNKKPGKKAEVQAVLSRLEQMSTERDRENLARFGINARKAFGVSMANIQVLAKRLGRNHELAAALWDTGVYEARMLTSFVDEPARVTPAQMALRAIGKRNPALNAAAVDVARRLADSPGAAARWVGKNALTELTSPP